MTSVGHSKISKAKFLYVFFQSHALSTRVGLADKRLNRSKVLPRVGARRIFRSSGERVQLEKGTYGTL